MKKALINYIKKEKLDDRYTPAYAIKPLLKYIPKGITVWECCDFGGSEITRVLKEYENTSVEERKAKYFKETCRCCRFHCENSKCLPDDIGKPIKSEVDFFPSHKGCKDFEWD